MRYEARLGGASQGKEGQGPASYGKPRRGTASKGGAVSGMAWSAYGWFVNQANCCVVGCGCVVAPIFLLGGVGGVAALIHFA